MAAYVMFIREGAVTDPEAMKKYQEGIEGTKKGETWVFLRKL